MSFQGTYAVADLDLLNTYEKLEESRDITERSDISKGTFSFWLNIDKEKVKVQIATGYVNIWHNKESYVYRAFDKLKPLVVNGDGEKCEHWVLKNMQQIGSIPIATSLTKEVGLLSKIEEADYQSIQECVDKIKTTKNKHILHSRIGQLRKLSALKRVAHYPVVLQCLEGCLDNPLVTENLETYRLVLETLEIILGFEQEHKSIDSDKIIQTIKDEISLKVISLMKEKPDFLRYTLSFLGRSGREEAVDLMFRHIDNGPSRALEGVVDSLFYDFARALAMLYPLHASKIDTYLDELMETGNETKVKVGQDLRKRISQETLH